MTLAEPEQRTAPHQPMSPDYLRFLMEHGPRFTEPIHLRGAFNNSDQLTTLLRTAINTITSKPDGTVRLRAFDGFALNYQLTNSLASTPPVHESDAPTWLRGYGGPTACIALNELARWSVPLAHWYIDRIRELIDVGGHVATEALDTYTFISAGEGWTPFGIHNDYEPSFIYHLGPGPKTAWVWPAGEPAGAIVSQSPALNGVSFSIAEHLSTATSYELASGDFLCIPAGLYHIFENTCPSAFLGITVFPTTPTRLFDKVLAGINRACRGDTYSRAELPEIRASLQTMAEHLNSQLLALTDQFDRHLRRLRSCGFAIAPHQSALQAIPHPTPAQPFSTRFPGVFQPADHDDQVFAYGRAARNGSGVESERLCTVLNSLNGSTDVEVAKTLDVPVDNFTTMLNRFALLGALVQ